MTSWADLRLGVANHLTGHGPDCSGCLDPVTHRWIAHTSPADEPGRRVSTVSGTVLTPVGTAPAAPAELVQGSLF